MFNTINETYYTNLFKMGWTAEVLIQNEATGLFPLSEKQCELLRALEKKVKG